MVDNPYIPQSYEEMVLEADIATYKEHELAMLSIATANLYRTSYIEKYGEIVSIINPYPVITCPPPTPFRVKSPPWHPTRDTILITADNIIHDTSEEIANLVFDKRLIDNPVIKTIWVPVVQKEMSGYIGTCMYPITLEWRENYWKEPDDVTIVEGLILCQDKRDAH